MALPWAASIPALWSSWEEPYMDQYQSRRKLLTNLHGHWSAPVQGQQLQLKQTSEWSDATSSLHLCCRASVSHSAKGALDVASRAPRDEGRSCRCRPFLAFPNWSIQISLENKEKGMDHYSQSPRDWSIRISLEIHMDQWLSNLSESSTSTQLVTWSRPQSEFPVIIRKGHININNFFRWLPGWGEGLPTGRPGVSRPVARGQKFMCCVRNPRNINSFVRVPGQEDLWPGWPRNCLCAKCLCAFSGP